MSNLKNRDSGQIMASSVRSSVSQALQKSFEDSVTSLRELIKQASWENDTLVNTTQHHFSFSKQELNAIAAVMVCWGARFNPKSAKFGSWTEQKILQTLRSILERVSAHKPWSFQEPTLMRRRSVPTYLGVMDTTQKQAVWIMESKLADMTESNDGAEHAGQRLVYGRLVLPWDAQTIFPGIHFCDEDGGHEETQELAISKILECPLRSKHYLKMCRKANAEEHGYAEQFNTVSLLHWYRIVLCTVGAAQFADAKRRERFSDLASELVLENKLLDSLYQPVDIVKSIVGHIDSFHRASVNMMKAVRLPIGEEERSATGQEVSDPGQAAVTQSTPKKLPIQPRSPSWSEAIQLQRQFPAPHTIGDQTKPLTAPRIVSPKQSMQSLQDVSKNNPQDILHKSTPRPRVRIPLNPGSVQKSSSSNTTGTRKTTQGTTDIKEARRRGCGSQSKHQSAEKDLELDLTMTGISPRSQKPPGSVPPNKKRKHATVETDDEDGE